MMISDLINKNKIYSWMLVFIILVQAYVSFNAQINNEKVVIAKKQQMVLAEQIERNKELLQKKMLEDTEFATNFAYISFFMSVLLVLGIILLVNFFIKNRASGSYIPHTAQKPYIAWNWPDAVKICVIFLFTNHIFWVSSALLSRGFSHYIFKNIIGDKRILMLIDTVMMDVFVVLALLYFVSIKYKQKIKALGLSFRNILKNLGIAAYGYTAFLPIMLISLSFVLFISKIFHYTPPPLPIQEFFFAEKRTSLLLTVTMTAVIAAPITEELFFRGFLYPAIRKKTTIFKSALISSLIFSFLHANILGFIPIILFGIFLAYIREKTNSIMPCIFIHTMHNFVLTIMMLFARKVFVFAQ